ncbi:hypothetical protein C4K22_6096 [Pseudomonas chlororaphis subsp. aurantiaca]|nr:hypothetical protein C4K22_6096 [Pseudomonas chlororaphis subsp. aurantiaca]AZD45135.1 hypothetical protein C4K21_6106 [Pseudomonas chlororaphis subsp. aurantiaca]
MNDVQPLLAVQSIRQVRFAISLNAGAAYVYSLHDSLKS